MLLRVGDLPHEPLAASAHFYAAMLPRVREALACGADLTLVFASADHTHREWRLALVRGLAREFAPIRVNAVAGNDDAGIAAAARYLSQAPGVTGQLLPTDGTGAGPMLYHPG